MTNFASPILVTGATGAIGRHLVDDLLDRGATVRALSRNPRESQIAPSVEVVRGDLSHQLPDAVFAGVRVAFVFPVDGVERFAAQAAEAGVEHLVVLSSLAAAGEHERDLRSPSYHHHLAIEHAIKASGADWTILRPGTFANNLLAWRHPLSQGDVVYGPYAQSAQAPIHEADIAAVAAVALTQDGHRSKTYAMTGPQALTREQQLHTIGDAAGRKLTYCETTPEAFQEAMGQFMPAEIIRMLIDYWSDTVAEPDTVRPGVAEVTGQPARTLTEWAADHAADFAKPTEPQPVG